MPVLGVLGHTDHGKSTFLEKLTGVNPMHLPEERKRGLTIQLGFAYWTPDAPGAHRITFIDVPGHERYLRNMLRGVLGMDAAVLLVAADDGLMPGTYEHMRASLFSGLAHGIVLITKTDLVSPERVEEVRLQLVEFLHGTFWEKMPMLTFASTNRVNMPDIKAKLWEMSQAAQLKEELSFAHYFIDRVFTAEGEGVVVTGTLRGKGLHVGDTLHLFPEGREVRVRKIMQDNTESDEAQPHSRVALNLSGAKAEQVNLGDLLLSVDAKHPTGRIAALLALPPEHMRETEVDWRHLEKKARDLNLIVGSAVLTVQSLEAVPINADTALAFITLEEKLPLMPGVHCVIYETGATTITCGGRVCATPDFGEMRHVRRIEVLTLAAAKLNALQHGAGMLAGEMVASAAAALELEMDGSLLLARRPELSLLPEPLELGARKALADALPSEHYLRTSQAAIPRVQLTADIDRAKRRLTEMLEANPMAGAQVLAKLLPKNAALLLLPQEAVAKLFGGTGLEYADGKLGVPGTPTGIPAQWKETYDRIMYRFSGDPSNFPTLIMLKQDYPAASKLLSELMANGELRQLGNEGAVITGELYEKWVGQIRQYLSRKGQITVSEAKEVTRATRKYIIPLLERMDRLGITRRDGDVRKPGAKF
jgi:selenocysteine-specific elongation factor